jgi:hypothetical protein
LALHKGSERIGKALTTNRSTSPIVIEIANKFCCTDRRRKYVQYEPTANQNLKIMPSATVPGQYPTIGTILDPPKFSLDTTFKYFLNFLKGDFDYTL